MANEFARALRKRMSVEEARLWSRLRQLKARGHHFRRQVPIEGYIVDFACLASRLIIEVDGGQHAEDGHALRDTVRDRHLNAKDFVVLRFWTRDLADDVDAALETIHTALRPSAES